MLKAVLEIIIMILLFMGVNESSAQIPSGMLDDLSPQAIEESIRGGISYLTEKQQSDGSWVEYPGFDPGTTALCALALHTSGVKPDQAVLARALDFLRRPLPDSRFQTYPIALQTMVLCLAEPDRDRELIQKNIDWLIARQFQTSNLFRGGWSYIGSHPEFDQVDNSNTQFAVLALYEAERIGIKIEPQVWQLALEYWLRMQNDDGSWGYRASLQNLQTNRSGSGTGSMTCAGIASLVICGGVRASGGARIQDGKIQCCQEVDEEISERIDRALNWLAKHFSIQTNPGTVVDVDTWLFYYLYGLERVGRLTAHRFIGRNDWYREGADFLLRRKGLFTKYWKAQRDLKGNHAVSTAFALLFLSKGRRPVLISKYKYGTKEQWNLHPNDLFHLTQKAEREWKMDLIWQVIDSEKATVDDLIQTPVLYICGTETPLPSDPAARRKMIESLRGYLEQGGFIIGESLMSEAPFEKGFVDLVREILPGEENEFRLLGPEHPIWSAEKSLSPDALRPIYGIDFGCRTSVLWLPSAGSNEQQAPLSCLWELAVDNRRRRDSYAEPILRSVDSALELGTNILAYATNREMKAKDEIPGSIAKELNKSENRQGELFVGLLECGGGISCAKRAIPNLMRALRTELGLPVQTRVSELRADNEKLYRFPILFMHGRHSFHWNEEERKNLAQYFDRGGFLFANAICASEPFRKSLEAEFSVIFPNAVWEDVPATDPLYSNRYGGYEIKYLELKKPVRQSGRKLNSEVVKALPALRGLKRNDRWIVLFSPWDVSCALELSGVSECLGYSRQSAFILSTNIFLYAVEHL